MVKADVKRDYYADLELPYGASAEEIKKQFRRLAKIYHPDRNPGREVDFIAKFQAIQAANEILTDPEQKLRYDQDRKKQGFVPPTVPKPSANPRTTVNNFPPPPRRTNTAGKAYHTGGSHKAPPSAGAQRYAPWARASAQEWQNAKEEAQTRADAFRGFSEMKSGPARGFPPPPPQRGRFVPTAQRPATSHVPPSANAPKPTTGWDQFSSGQAGFPGMSRTQSTRRKQGFDPSTPSGDEHMAGTSAYSGVRRGKQPQASTAEASYFDARGSPVSPDEDLPQSPPSPLRHTRSHEDTAHMRPGLNRQSTRYARSGGEKTDVRGSGLGRSASVRSSRVNSGDEDHTARRPRSYQGGARFHSTSPGSRTRGFAATYSDDSTSSESSSGEENVDISGRSKATPRSHRYRDAPPPQAHVNPNLHSTQPVAPGTYYKYPPPPDHNTPFYPQGYPPASNAQTENRSGNSAETTDANGSSFSASQNGSAATSSDHLKAFSASEWDGKFHADSFAPTPHPDQDRKSPSKTTRRGTTQSRTQGTSPGRSTDSNSVTDPLSNTSSAFQAPKFDADKWREQLNDRTWATPAPDVGRSWDRKRSSKSNGTTKKPKPPSNASEGGKPASVSVNGASSMGEMPKPTIADEMDIDQPQESSNPAEAEEYKANNASQDDEKSESVNLGDLGQVHPIKPSSAGLGDFGDLSSTLPFESRAAPSINLEGLSASLSRVKDMNLPRPPKAPIAPIGESLSPGRWITYSNAMSAYMKEWSSFNKQILEHFAIRQAQLDHNMANNWIISLGDGPTDIAALEKRSGSQAGYKTYMTWIQQDEAVRKWWDVACERHRTAMTELGFVRERMKAASTARVA